MTIETALLRPGYEISRVIKGGWQLAGGHGAFDRTTAIADMARFFDAGITAFDCADIYTGVEEMIGAFISDLRASRGAAVADDVRIHTKLVPDLDRLAAFGPADAEAIVDRSLKRLNLERLHLVQFYWWDLAIGRPVEVMASLKRLQEKGKILHLGTTNWDTDEQDLFLDAGLDLATAQVQYSLLDARPAGRFASWCAQNRISILCYGTLAGGFFSDAWLGAPDPGYEFANRSLVKYRLIIDEFGGWVPFQDLLATLDRIARKHGVTLSAVASRAMLDRPGVAAVIIGARTADNLDRTLALFGFSLDDADNADIAGALSLAEGPHGPVYALERDRTGRHGRIMRYNLGTGAA